LKSNIAIILKAFIHKSNTWGQMELKDLLSDSGKSIAVTDYRYLPKNQILADSDILRLSGIRPNL
jgi:hypothetical protein